MAKCRCLFCDSEFERREGGKPQRFCSAGCRRQYHEAARNWALRALDDGRLTLADIMNPQQEAPRDDH